MTAVVAVVAGVAVASGGYAAQRVDLGDASVWVANDEQQAVGRANTAVLELNSVVETGGSGAEIVQQGSTVLVLDRDARDASASSMRPRRRSRRRCPCRPTTPPLALAGDRVVVAADGEVWTAPADRFADFDGDADPMLNFGPGAVTSRRPDGRALRVHAAAPARSRASTRPTRRPWPRGGSSRPSTTTTTCRSPRSPSTGPCSTRTARTLWVEGREVPLSGLLEATDEPVLPGSGARGRSIAVAHRARPHHRRRSTAASRVARRRRRSAPPAAPMRARRVPATPRGAAARPGADARGGDVGPLELDRRPAPATSRSPSTARRSCSTTGGAARPGRRRRLRAHRQLGRAARARARRGDDRAERSRRGAHRREEPGGADAPRTTPSVRGPAGRRCCPCC